jgi:hypothetical protein
MGDVYDAATGACISSQYTETQFPTYLDYKTDTFRPEGCGIR